ncbi:lipid II flippase MurJ [Meiothermus taiwanensis]|uniref:lipid II flippase MurJ n=1 Tax=Meiothermus taiwanensis TaxID=172827 RepID=UPI0015FDBC0D|nr:lipid II flippase MurJ [Meiothermus taiwanensis]
MEEALLRWLPDSWRLRLRSIHAGHKAVLRGMVWLSVFVLAAKGIAALKEIAVAYRFGTSEVLEGYLLVFNLATWPAGLLFVVMHFSLVPALVHKQSAPDSGRAWQRRVAAWVWLVGLLAGGLVVVILPPLIQSGLLGLTPEGRQAALAAVPWLAPAATLGVVAGWHACQLMSRQQHVNTFLEAVPAVGVLLAVLLVPMATIDVLLWGTLAGFLAHWALLILIARVSGFPVVPKVTTTWPFDRALSVNAGWLLAGQLLMGVGGVIDQIILAHMPAGALATFSYANRVMALVLTLTATVAGRALLPVLPGLSAEGAYTVARRWAVWFFALGVFGSAFIAATAPIIIELLFQRGAFTADDTTQTASLLMGMALQLPFYLVGTVWVQWLLTRPDHGRTLWWAAVYSVVAKLAVTLGLIVLAGWQAQAVVAGLVAASVVYLVSLVRR